MKNLFKFSIAILAVTTVSSCNTRTEQEVADNTAVVSYTKLESANWLIGQWQNNSDDGKMIEAWEKLNDSTYAGTNYFITGKDTVSSETVSFEQRGNDLFYIPTVKEQNERKPISFKLTSSTNDQMIFENPKHDYPQKITYTKISNDSLVAEISGTMGGQLNTQQFPMSRVK